MTRPDLTHCTLVAVALAGLSVASCRDAAPPAPDAATAAVASDALHLTDEAARDAGVEIAAVRTIERADAIEAVGTIGLDERRTARLGSLVEGVVRQVAVQPGDGVRAGQRLASLHSHVIHDAWAGYFKALASRRAEERAVAFAEIAEQRAKRLFDDKAFSREEAERAVVNHAHAEQALAAARADVTRAEDELRHYGMTPSADADPHAAESIGVTAPFAGTVIERLASEGAAVVPGTPLLVVSDLSTLWVAAEVDERHLPRLARGHDAGVTVAAYPGETFAGRIDAIGDTIQSTTRRVVVRVTVANADRRLKPQMFATVRLGAAAPRQVLVVPTEAVQQMDGESLVFVRSADGRYQRRAVAIGAETDGLVEITRGLADGEAVVRRGAFLLKSALATQAGEP